MYGQIGFGPLRYHHLEYYVALAQLIYVKGRHIFFNPFINTAQ